MKQETGLELTIDEVGAKGDGVATLNGEKVYVPYVLPGERVKVIPEPREPGDVHDTLRVRLDAVVAASPDRASHFPCTHFGACGGCSMQHWQPGAYLEWKRGIVEKALRQKNIEAEVMPCHPCAPETRRRVVFAAMRTKKTVRFGFFARGSHTLVDVKHCPVMTNELETAMPKVANLIAPGLTRKGLASVQVTMTKAGLDVDVTGGKKDLDVTLRQILAEGAADADLARLSWDGDIVAERRTPTLNFAGVDVALPPGAFLQATRESEAEMVKLILEGVGDAASIVDLFAGCGTFSLALGRRAPVYALEGASAQCKALEQAVRRNGPAVGLKPFVVERRDLARRPLPAELLNKHEAVVIDPPRAGAAAQTAELARSIVPTIVSVSCNPATFARDARMLLDGGYKLEKVTPLDQFLWSSHIELVGVFKKG